MPIDLTSWYVQLSPLRLFLFEYFGYRDWMDGSGLPDVYMSYFYHRQTTTDITTDSRERSCDGSYLQPFMK